MLELLKEEANITCTENGGKAYTTSGSACLDLFGTVGALRRQQDDEIEKRFMRAFLEDKNLAMKLLFYTRDVRGGLGERRVFRTAIKWLAENSPESLSKILPYIAEYGRLDDLMELLGSNCEESVIAVIKSRLAEDKAALEADGAVSLLGKWLPSVNATNTSTVKKAKHLARKLKMREADYRKLLTRLRARIRILENNLRTGDYSFDYSKQPSKAMYKYRKAFLRNDGERYCDFLQQVKRGTASLHTGTLTPFDIVQSMLGGWFGMKDLSAEEREAADVTWKALEDFTHEENALVVVDGSGSMYSGGTGAAPIAVAASLGIYYAEHNKGAFKDHFITFSTRPQLVELKGKDIYERVRYCLGYKEVANTDLEKVFRLILNTAVKNHLPQEDLPEKLYIISDMEFDQCAQGADVTTFEAAKAAFEKHGYRLPKVVFWNVDSRNAQQPVKQNEQGVVLVSGNTARIFDMLKGDLLNPYQFMMEILNSERYRNIAA